MKKVIILFLVSMCSLGLVAFTTSNVEKVIDFEITLTLESEYQKGWKEGHCEGWKDVKGKNAYCPYPPYAPYPKYPKSSDSFRDGYNDGFKRGMSDARKN